jgi:hypothetical protein
MGPCFRRDDLAESLPINFKEPRRHREATDRANASFDVVPAKAGTHTARNRVSAMKRKSFATSNARGGSLRSQGRLGREFVDQFQRATPSSRGNGSRECISEVVPANAGTHTARNRVSAMKRKSLQTAMPGVMGPCFRRDDLAESLSINFKEPRRHREATDRANATLKSSLRTQGPIRRGIAFRQ